jgi:hypothetical protein
VETMTNRALEGCRAVSGRVAANQLGWADRLTQQTLTGPTTGMFNDERDILRSRGQPSKGRWMESR